MHAGRDRARGPARGAARRSPRCARALAGELELMAAPLLHVDAARQALLRAAAGRRDVTFTLAADFRVDAPATIGVLGPERLRQDDAVRAHHRQQRAERGPRAGRRDSDIHRVRYRERDRLAIHYHQSYQVRAFKRTRPVVPARARGRASRRSCTCSTSRSSRSRTATSASCWISSAGCGRKGTSCSSACIRTSPSTSRSCAKRASASSSSIAARSRCSPTSPRWSRTSACEATSGGWRRRFEPCNSKTAAGCPAAALPLAVSSAPTGVWSPGRGPAREPALRQLDRHVDLPSVALDQERNALARGLSTCLCSSSTSRLPLVPTPTMTSPAWMPAFAAGPVAFCTTSPSWPTSFFSSAREAAARRRRACPCSAAPIVRPLRPCHHRSVPTVAVTDVALPSRQTSSASFVPGAVLPMRLVTSVLSLTATPSILRITSPLLIPAFSAGLSFSTLPMSAPLVSGRPKVCASDWLSGWMPTPRRPCAHLARRLEAGRRPSSRRPRESRTTAHVAARAAVDLRVDADDLTRGIQQRSARIAGIDGDVGLDERRHLAAGQRAMHAADNPRRHAVLEAERRADRDHPFAALDRGRRGKVERRQVLGIDLDSAMSVRLSVPITLAVNSRRSVSLTVTSVAPSTTCALVTM